MIIIYHSQDLDGKASGAIGALNFPEATLVPYHYNELIDIERFRDQDVLMADVTFDLQTMWNISNIAKSFILIDHHISAFEKIYEDLQKVSYQEREFSGLIKEYTAGTFTYYFSAKLSACEMMLQIFPAGNENTKENIRLLGQYDTWRNTDEKRFSTDRPWNVVMQHQFGARTAATIPEVTNMLFQSPEDIFQIGYAILKYQKAQNEVAMARHFVFELNGIRIIACNGAQKNSSAFEGYYNEWLHDAMMPYVFDGQKKVWDCSLYTTKPEVDILSIAKNFGGGGHAQACGFQLPFDQLNFNGTGLNLGSIIIFDIAQLPKDMSPEKAAEIIKAAMKNPGMLIESNPIDVKSIEVVEPIYGESIEKKLILAEELPKPNLLSDADDLDIPFAGDKKPELEVKKEVKPKTTRNGKSKPAPKRTGSKH